MIENRPLAQLIRHPDNARLGDVDEIKQMIRANGWHGVVVVQKSTGYLLAGNHRTEAAEELQRGNFDPYPEQTAEEYEAEKLHWREELAELPAHVLDVDDQTALRILLSDNRATDLATYDDSKLLRLTAQILEPEAAMQVLTNASSTPEDITEALRVLAADKVRSSGSALRGTGYRADDVEQLALAMAPAEGAGWGSAGEGRVEIYDSWEESELRQLVMPMHVSQYDKVIELLTEVQQKQGLITNTDAFFWCLQKALPRKFTAPEAMRDEEEGAAPKRQKVTADA